MTFLEGLTLFVLIVTGILVPIILFVVKRQDFDRANRFGELNGRLNHLDDCIDSLRTRVIGQSISRVDFEAALLQMRRELQEAVTGQTEARHSQASLFSAQLLSSEERVAHRLDRLEDVYFNMSKTAGIGAAE